MGMQIVMKGEERMNIWDIKNPDKDLWRRRKSMVRDKDQNRVSFYEDWEFYKAPFGSERRVA